ncbi:MAG: prolipoprotein diacylglyceryl transferase [Desulfovibrionaceae bacterium]
MLVYPRIDPVALSIGPLAIHWYGLMYMIGFATAWLLGRHRARKPGSGWTPQQVDDCITYCIAGLILGARFGYVLFYDLPVFLAHPLDIFAIWKGGMSFHGGLIGIIVCLLLFARKTGKNFFQIGDFLVPLAPPGLLAGRLGNFINGELWGRFTDLPWGMVFPGGGIYPRHPSQLYEALLEGVTLFCILWWYTARPRPTMAASGLFLFCYGLFRFTVEFARQPDIQLGFIAFGWLTMGQLLCLPMFLAGIALFALAHAKK